MAHPALSSLTIRSIFSQIAASLGDLPWERPLQDWPGHCSRLEELPRGLSRHPVLFINADGVLLALKELPTDTAKKEYDLLTQIEERHLPAVTPIGYAQTRTTEGEASVLITRYLERSIPYRSLFMRNGLERYREHLLDAIAGLLVQLHLAGVFWGDCSLSNTLFRRDAGTLQAYMVDAETAEIYPPRLSPTLRLHDLEIMEVDVEGDLADLDTLGLLAEDFTLQEVGNSIRRRYQSLWEEITREEIISPDERDRIQERIRVLNALGFSVGDVEMQNTTHGNKIRFRVMVTDRNFHRDQLFGLTGLEAEEMQARQMMNEIQEVKAMLSQNNNRSTPISVAAYYWLEHYYQPVIKQLEPLLVKKGTNHEESLGPAELYCQILEHKWYLSEQAHHDVGHQAAADDFLLRFMAG